MLDDRKRAILSAVIEDFIYSAEPVGSKRLVEKYGWPISPATVRNELALLEDMGYLSHPYTSAGRVPTDKGYRCYVDDLSEMEAAVPAKRLELSGVYGRLTHEIGELMRETSHFLSRLTSSLAIVYAPDTGREKIKHIDLIDLAPGSLMIVAIMSNGAISKQVIEIDASTSADTLMNLERRLNEALAGATIGARWSEAVGLDGLTQHEAALLNAIADSVLDSLSMGKSDQVYYDGAAHLLNYPELADPTEMRRVMALIEHNYALLEWLHGAPKTGDLTVSIGAENELDLSGYTVIAGSYGVRGEIVGVLGVLGPTRMDYRRAISAVKQIADHLGSVLAELEG